MANHEELLRQFMPLLRYDSQEMYFADSARQWTDNASNELRRAPREGVEPEVLARPPELTLEFLGRERYGNGEPVEKGDHIGDRDRDYREQYARLRNDDNANRVYARAVEDRNGRLWLQYWLWYFYNDYRLAFDKGLHEGDWESVQLRIDGERPDVAVYAAHAFATSTSWDQVHKADGRPDTPVVYVARGSHGSYFRPGRHDTEVWVDIADGKREPRFVEIEFLDGLEWPSWPGRWGDTQVRTAKVDSPSPTGPGAKEHWKDPALLLEEAHDFREERVRKPGDPPEVDVKRTADGRLRLVLDVSDQAKPPRALVVNVNAPDDPAAPRAYTFPLAGVGRLDVVTDVVLDPAKQYEVNVSVTGHDDVPTGSRPVWIRPRAKFNPLTIVRGIGRVFVPLVDRAKGIFRRRRDGAP